MTLFGFINYFLYIYSIGIYGEVAELVDARDFY
jgi:hypothetical protein